MRSANGEGRERAPEHAVFPFDGAASRIHSLAFIKYRLLSLAAAVAIYALVMLATGDSLGVSSNYFVILPVLAAALGYGKGGGLVAGILGLPANLLMYSLLRHPEFSPASKAIAEASGVVVGCVFGFLADYFRLLESEIKRRMEVEEALHGSLEAQELLLRELHHRVKNNLNVIKSLVQLQRSRSADPAFRAASDELVSRILAISLVHDQLDKDQTLASVEIGRYVEALAGDIASGFGLGAADFALSVDTGSRRLPVEQATSLGLIVNEALTNAHKHSPAFCRDGRPRIALSLWIEDEDYCLEVHNEAPSGASDTGERPDGGKGLGLKLVQALARNLGGDASFRIVNGDDSWRESVFELVFPTEASKLEDL
jgi:two-component sensor histidine kinase